MKTRTISALRDSLHCLMRIFLNNKLDLLLVVEFFLLLILYAIFMFYDRVPLLGFVVLGMVWITRLWMTGIEGIAATPLDLPIFGILALLPISLLASTDWSLSLPKVYGIILGISIFYAVVNAISTISRLELAITGIMLLGISVAFLGLIGTDWASSKFFSLPEVYGHLPRLIQGVPRSISGGIQPNIVGGALTFFIPFLVSLLFYRVESKTTPFKTNARLTTILRTGYKPLLFLSLALTFLTLILTQSRGALAGIAVGLFVLALWYDRRFLWTIPLVGLAFFVLIRVWGVGNLAELASHLDISGGITFPGRLEIWQRAIYIIQDFPFTGVGIGTFDPVAHVLYPFFLVGPDVQVPHAHNMILTVAVDLGIPGLILYAAMLSGFALSAWRAYQTAAKPLRGLIMGIACGMLAHQIFGIMDAFMLGTKLGAVMWLFLGLVVTLYIRRDQLAMEFTKRDLQVTNAGRENVVGVSAFEHTSARGQWQSRLRSFFRPFVYWTLFSMLAISLIVDHPYLGLAIALVGGGILGFICLQAAESRSSFKQIQ
jgi:putative inorganic carbon (HCO3(-)) transporter